MGVMLKLREKVFYIYLYEKRIVINYGFHFVYFTAARAVAETDIALYIGLGVAIAVFTVVAFFVIRLMRRKGRDHVMYDMAPSGKSTFNALKN